MPLLLANGSLFTAKGSLFAELPALKYSNIEGSFTNARKKIAPIREISRTYCLNIQLIYT
jgi:hypothetical protein